MSSTAAPTTTSRASSVPWILMVAIVGLGLMGVAAFAAGGTELFVSLIETGMAWCF